MTQTLLPTGLTFRTVAEDALRGAHDLFLAALHNKPASDELWDVMRHVYVADSNHHRILVVDAATGRVSDVVGSGAPGFGDGGFDTARFDQPQGMALSGDGSTLYVADLGNHAIRAIDLRVYRGKRADREHQDAVRQRAGGTGRPS